MHKLVILGASGHGKVVADIVRLTGQYDQMVFLDDNESQPPIMGIPVIGDCGSADKLLQDADFFVAIGNAKLRKRFLDELIQKGANIATGVEIDAGSVVMAGAVLNADCKLGRGCIINTCASVDHDCIIGDYVHISVGAHLAGTVAVGNSTWIGAGAIVNNNITITESCMIGSGAVVVKDIQQSGTYVGVPARRLN